MAIKIKYAEPAEYIPKELRQLYKLGEYAEPKQEQQQRAEASQSGEGAAEPDQTRAESKAP